MTVLLVKTSSLGDVLHTLPALTDIYRVEPKIRFHWLVEENLVEIPSWHPAVERVIPFPWRRGRRSPEMFFSGAWRRFLSELRHEIYDGVLDAQGLIKSAIPARLARGPCAGPDRQSAREPWAALFYHQVIPLPAHLHAVDRLRQLFATYFRYPLPQTPAEYGLKGRFPTTVGAPVVLFLHGTTWTSKHWPEDHWHTLARLLGDHAQILLPWNTPQERQRGEAMAHLRSVRLLDRTNLEGLAGYLVGASVVVAVDSGPAHLAAALEIPAVCLYGPTDPAQIGTRSPGHHHLCGPCSQGPCRKRTCPLDRRETPPCMRAITPEDVASQVLALL